MYSLIRTCKLNGINLRAYLEYVLIHIADHSVTLIDELLCRGMGRADKLKANALHASSGLTGG